MVGMPYGENRYLEVSRDIIPSIKLWFSRLLIRCFIIPVGETASLIRNCSAYEAVTPTPAVLIIVFCGDGSTEHNDEHCRCWCKCRQHSCYFGKSTRAVGGRDSLVGIAIYRWLEGRGIESRWGEISHAFQTGSEARPASCTGSFLGVKRP